MKVSLSLVFLLFFQSLFAQYDFSAIDSRLEAEKKQVEGHVVALIYKDGKLFVQGGYQGLAKMSDEELKGTHVHQ